MKIDVLCKTGKLLIQNWNDIEETNLLPSYPCGFQKVLALHCIDFCFICKICVKQLMFFERTVVTASDFKNCTTIHCADAAKKMWNIWLIQVSKFVGSSKICFRLCGWCWFDMNILIMQKSDFYKFVISLKRSSPTHLLESVKKMQENGMMIRFFYRQNLLDRRKFVLRDQLGWCNK